MPAGGCLHAPLSRPVAAATWGQPGSQPAGGDAAPRSPAAPAAAGIAHGEPLARARGAPTPGSSPRASRAFAWLHGGNRALLVHQFIAFQILVMQVVNVLRKRQHATAPGGQTNTLLVLAAALLGCGATLWRRGQPYWRNR